MGCLTVIKNMKKRYERAKSQFGSRKEKVSTEMPQLQASRSLHFDPQSPNTSVKSPYSINRVTNNRTRTLSAPSALEAAEQEALASIEQEKLQMSKTLERLMKEPRVSDPIPSPVPSPLPLPPSPRSRGPPLRLRMTSDPFYASGSGNNTAEQDGLETFQHDAREWSKNRDRSMKNKHLARPLPLPPKGRSPSKATSSPKLGTVTDSVRFFLYEEIVAACHNFCLDRCMAECFSSTIYKASFLHDASCKKLKATVTRLHPSNQDLREFMNEVSTLAKMQHPNICKLLGFYACDTSETRMVVYERLSNGSLDSLLFRRPDGPSIDWNTRMKIAFSAAQGLAFLHEEGPFKAMYNDFSAVNIQIDIDFTAKLSGYGFVGHVEEAFSRSSAAAGNLSVETSRKGKLTRKSNVWGFGIVLLELLTGRKNFDLNLPKRERNLVKWCQPFLTDNLFVIMDSQLEGRFPPKAARMVADIAQRCLKREPSDRPSMRAVIENLKILQDMQYPRWFPLHEPTTVYRRQTAKSLSVEDISYGPSLGFSPPCLPPPIGTPTSQPPRWSSVPVPLPPPLPHSSNVITGEIIREESTKQPSLASEKASLVGN